MISIKDNKGSGRKVAQGRGVCGAERRADEKAKSQAVDDTDADKVSAEPSGVLPPNPAVEESTRHRLKWLAQVSEFWPLSKLATHSDEEMLE